MTKLGDEGYNDLKKRTFTSVIWSVVRVVWTTLASFVIFVMLARILGPADFGVFALATLFVEICRIFANAGLGDAVIRQADLDEELADTAFWANLGLSLGIAVLVMGLAPLYGNLVKNPLVIDILRALAFTLPISALGGIHGARLTRDYRHKTFAIQTAISSVVSGLAGIGAALYGLGVWSLVVQAWVAATLSVGMAWTAMRWVPGLRFSVPAFKSIAGFSFSMTFNQVLWILMGRVSDIFISRAFGAAELGRYRIAWRMYELIGQIALSPIGSVAMLTFSKLQNDPERLRAAYYRLVGVVGLLSLPLILGYAALADEIIELLFSAQWAGVGKISQVLSLMAIPFVFNYISPGVLAALNKSGAITKVAVVQLILTIVLTWLALPFGLLGVAAAYVIRSYVTFPYQQKQLKTFGDIPFSMALRTPLVPLIVAVVMSLIVWAARPLLLTWTGSTMGVVISGALLGGTIYVTGIWLFGRSLITPVIDQLTPMLGRFIKPKS